MTFFRALFLLLVFANLVFFAWAQGYFGGQTAGREPQRLDEQLVPDKLRIVGSGAAVAARTEAAGGTACRLVTGLPLAEADALKTALGDGLSVDIRPIEESPSYWVHLPPQASLAVAEKKAVELRQLGIKDFHIVLEEGASRFALSLGLFKSEAAANEFLQGMVKRGVRTARIEVREKTGQQARAVVRGTAENLSKRLPEALAKIPGAAAAECPAP